MDSISFVLTTMMLTCVTLGRRHFDPLFDIPIELPTPFNTISQNYIDSVKQQQEQQNEEVDVEQIKRRILNNKTLMQRIALKSHQRKAYPVLECLKRCNSSDHWNCCKIFYKKIQIPHQKPLADTGDEVFSFRSLAPSVPLLPGLSGTMGVLGTVVGVIFAGYRVSRAWTDSNDDNSFNVFDQANRVFIHSEAEDWIKQLETYLHENDLENVDSFLCCLHIGKIYLKLESLELY